MTPRPDAAFSGTVTQHAFDPAAFAQRQTLLEQRLSAALERIGDSRLIERVRAPLTRGTAADLFALLADDDVRVARAAHECAMLRFAFIVTEFCDGARPSTELPAGVEITPGTSAVRAAMSPTRSGGARR